MIFINTRSAPAVVVLALWLVSGAIAQHRKPTDGGTGLTYSDVEVTGIDAAPSRGPRDAKVIIVEFADYSCPYTIKFEPTLRKVVDEGQVRFVVMHHWIPAHKHAQMAAQVAVAAGLQGKFWEVHNLMLAEKFAAGPEGATLDGYAKYLSKVPGLDVDRLVRDAASSQVARTVDREVHAIGSNATPELVVNGRMFLAGEITADQLHTLIAEASH